MSQMSANLGVEPLRVLIVCSANISRSPAAEALLRQQVNGLSVQVASAGLLPGGRSADLQTALAVSDYGADLSGHVSRRLTSEILSQEGRDLVIAMCRAHLRELVVNDPTVWPRVVTLKELCRYLHLRDVDRVRSLGQVLTGRRMSSMIGDDPADDVADVHGMALEHHREMVASVHRLTAEVARWLGSIQDPQI
jgi:protein-tyrosine-phosphatase